MNVRRTFAACLAALIAGGCSLTRDVSPTSSGEVEPAPVAPESRPSISPRTLRVRVVGEDGLPKEGVHVGIRAPDPFWESELRDVFVTRTRGDGTAEFRLAPMPEDGRIDGETVSVAISRLFAEPVAVSLRELPREPVELVLPGHGSLEVRFVDAAGKILTEPADAELEIVDHPDFSSPEDWFDRYPERHDERLVRKRVTRGKLTQDCIGLGLELEVRATFERWRPVKARIRGPSVQGERTVVLVPVLAPQPVLVGRCLAADGEPIAGGAFRSELRVADPDGSDRYRGDASSFATDEEGRFSLEVSPRLPSRGDLTFLAWTDTDDGRRWWGESRWTGELVPAANEIGDVELAPLTIAARGRILDEEDRPVEGAEVSLSSLATATQGWIHDARSDSEGSFCLQTGAAVAEVALTVTADGYVRRELTQRVGTEDARIALVRAGGVEGSLLVSDRFALRHLSVSVERRGTGERQVTDDFDGGGRFQLTGLAPGSYSVRVELDDEPESTIHVADVEVRGGLITRDLACQAIDLRERIRTFRIEVQGTPEDDVGNVTYVELFVQRRASGTETFPPGVWAGTSGLLVLTTAHPALDLRLTPRHGRCEELAGVSGDRTLVFRQGIPISIRLVPPVPLRDGEFLTLRLTSVNGIPVFHLAKPEFLGGERVDTWVPEAGSYRVELEFRHPVRGDLVVDLLPLDAETLLRVGEPPAPADFPLTLPRAALDAIDAARR